MIRYWRVRAIRITTFEDRVVRWATFLPIITIFLSFRVNRDCDLILILILFLCCIATKFLLIWSWHLQDGYFQLIGGGHWSVKGGDACRRIALHFNLGGLHLFCWWHWIVRCFDCGSAGIAWIYSRLLDELRWDMAISMTLGVFIYPLRTAFLVFEKQILMNVSFHHMHWFWYCCKRFLFRSFYFLF